MHILSFLAIIFFGLCALVAAQPPQVQLYEFQDGTHAYVAHARYAYMPSDNQQRLLAQTEYNRAVQQAAFDGKVAPSAMSASWWPDRYGRGGTMILHSSIKGGRTNADTQNFLNDCNIGGHRYRGMCAEIGTMTWAQSLFRDEGHIPTSARVQWSVYGVTSHVTGQTGFLPPCSDAGAPGCATYVDQLARAVGGGGRCLTRREPEPAPPIRPHRQDTDTPDAPITPGTPPKTGRPTNKDDPESPTRLGQNQQKPKDDPDAPAKEKGGFERGAVCSLPNRAGIKPKVTKRDIWGARAGLFGMH